MSDSSHPTGTTPDALKPCPFCGNTKVVVESDRDGDGEWYIQCQSSARVCPFVVIHCAATSREQAVKAWNRRAVLPPGASTTEAEVSEARLRSSDAARLATFADLLASQGNYRDVVVTFSRTPPDGGAVYVEIDGVRGEGGDPLDALRLALDAIAAANRPGTVAETETVARPLGDSPAAVVLAAAEWLVDSQNRARGMGYSTARALSDALKTPEVVAWSIAQRTKRSAWRAEEGS